MVSFVDDLTEYAMLLIPDACLQTAVAHVRFVAVSATIPNVRDIAAWLEVPEAGILVFGEEMRPVRLRTIVKGYSPAKNDFLFEKCAAKCIDYRLCLLLISCIVTTLAAQPKMTCALTNVLNSSCAHARYSFMLP